MFLLFYYQNNRARLTELIKKYAISCVEAYITDSILVYNSHKEPSSAQNNINNSTAGLRWISLQCKVVPPPSPHDIYARGDL